MQTWNLNIFLINSYYADLQLKKQQKMDNTQMEGQTNNKEPALANIMVNLCNITNSIKGIEQRLGKLEIISNKVDELETKQNPLKNDSRKLNQLKTSYVTNLANKKNK